MHAHASDGLDPDAASPAGRTDEASYRDLVEPYRAELLLHCYRLLGSHHDAEDALQDALVRAWRGLGNFQGRSSLRLWLYRIATNVCLDVIGRRLRLPAPAHDGREGTAGEEAAAWLEPYPDDLLLRLDHRHAPEARYEALEGIELAFVIALQHLVPLQRAVLVMREVLGFSAAETAEALTTTTAAVNSALQRARRVVADAAPEQSQQRSLRVLGDDGVERLVSRYVRAWEDGDVDTIVTMLAEDARYSMPPGPSYAGTAAIRAFLVAQPLRLRWRFVPVRANGQVAFGTYAWDEDRRAYVASALDVLTVRGDRISAVTAFLGRHVLRPFGLPDELPT